MESTLSLMKSDFEAEVGHFLGYSRDSALWDTYQLGDIRACINSGCRRFYYPKVNGDTYEWSFFRVKKDRTLASGASTVNCPDDFGSLEGRVNVASSSSSSYFPVAVVGEPAITDRYALNATATGQPELVAVMPIKGTTATHGQRFQLYVYPLADTDYTLTFTYNLHPDALTDKSPYAYGGPEHHETILASCRAVAEKDLDDAAGLHTADFQECLAASVAMDRKLKPQLFGYNRDRSDDNGFWRGGRTLESDLVTFNGTLWD